MSDKSVAFSLNIGYTMYIPTKGALTDANLNCKLGQLAGYTTS